MVAIFRGSTGSWASHLQIASSYTLMEVKMSNPTLNIHCVLSIKKRSFKEFLNCLSIYVNYNLENRLHSAASLQKKKKEDSLLH